MNMKKRIYKPRHDLLQRHAADFGHGAQSLTVRSRAVAAFTLIELMIVMAIISIIALLAIANYSGVQRQARLDFGADGLASLMKEQMLYARSGRLSPGNPNNPPGDRSLQCYGMQIFSGKLISEGALNIGQSDYIAVPLSESNPDDGNPQADFEAYVSGVGSVVDVCSQIANWSETGFLDNNLKIKSVILKSKLGDGDIEFESSNSLDIYFKPPYGKAFWFDSGQFRSLSNYVIQVKMNFDDSEYNDRIIEFDPDTGSVVKKNQQTS
jgi:prepilin-type N-terminal cleavage/methylation domain-containing protein